MSESEVEFEKKLKRELERVEAPEGFADRMMDRIARERKRRLVVMAGRYAWTAVAAMVLVGTMLAGWQWRLRQERREAEVARRQFEVAMQVTGRTLVEVREQIQRAGEVHSAGRKQEVE